MATRTGQKAAPSRNQEDYGLADARFTMTFSPLGTGGAERWTIRDRRGIIPDLVLKNVLDAQFVLNSLNSYAENRYGKAR